MKISKKILIHRQLKYNPYRIKEVGISLEIILNAFKCLTLSISSKILVLAIVPLLFISVSILCKVSMSNVYILLSPQEEETISSSLGDRCKYLAAQWSERLNSLSVIVLVCLGKKQDCKTTGSSLVP